MAVVQIHRYREQARSHIGFAPPPVGASLLAIAAGQVRRTRQGHEKSGTAGALDQSHEQVRL